MTKFVMRGIFLCLTMLTISIHLFAQNSGTITGTIVDPSGAVISGATVQAIDQAKGITVRETKSGASGSFTLQPLQPGTYSIRIKANGMKELTHTDIVLDNRQVLGLGDIAMTLGASTEQITVESTAPLVETATSDKSAVIDARQISEISMNGRDFQSLVRTLPGVTSNDAIRPA